MENYFARIVGYLLAQSWQIAVLTVVVAVAAFALKNRSAHVRYLLWLVVLAKCLVPPLYTVPFGILPAAKRAVPPPSKMLVVDNEPVASEAMDSTAVDTRPAEVPEVSAVRQVTSQPLGLVQWLGIAWLIGVGVYLAMNLLRALRANYWLWKTRKALPAEFQASVSDFFAAYGLKVLPRIWLVDDVSQPFVWGLLRGSIYLPADFLNVSNPGHRRNVLGHELSHVLRFDASVNLLQVIAQAVFWFHPFVWWANRNIRAEREKCCDEMAIARLNASPKDYGTAIVETLAIRNKSTRPVPSLAVVGPVKNIEERIKTMLRPGKKFYKRPSLVDVTVALLLASLIVPMALVLTARAETKPTAEQKPEPAKSLHQAAAAGDIEQVKSLISKGADVNAKDKPLGRTALHYASEKGHTEVARLLISQGAYVNAMCRPGGTPLHYAVIQGDRQTVELLLSKGADINAKNKGGRTPLFEAMASSAARGKEVVALLTAKGARVPALHLAAYMGDMERLKKCLQDGMDINSKEDAGCTALHAAVNSGKKDIVEFLIGKYANTHARDTYGVTPLYYAAIHNYEDIADFLLAKGADANAGDENGLTLLYYAIWDKSKDAIKLLIRKGANVNAKDRAGYTPLVYAIWENDKDMVELLIANGADVNIEDNDGYTPYYWAVTDASKDIVELLTAKGATVISTIHLAARAGDLARVKRFMEEGTDVNARDKGGETPLFSAVQADNDDVARFLIAEGADVNARDNIGATPLNFAIRARVKKDMLELLIAKGADVNAKTERGQTPLHSACVRGEKDVVELLIGKGADITAKITSGSAVGWTLLHFATASGQAEIAELLIAKGADIDSKASNGHTPLHIACERGHKDVAELLIAKGADMNAKDNKQQSALSLAKEQGHEEIVGLLRKHGAKE